MKFKKDPLYMEDLPWDIGVSYSLINNKWIKQIIYDELAWNNFIDLCKGNGCSNLSTYKRWENCSGCMLWDISDSMFSCKSSDLGALMKYMVDKKMNMLLDIV